GPESSAQLNISRREARAAIALWLARAASPARPSIVIAPVSAGQAAMSRPIREISRTIATATRTKLATARQRIHEAVERSSICLADPPARTALATIGCIRLTGIRVTGIVTQSAAANGEAA